jgi:EAL and modified HD-GYP domain-containing signal transduction protein
VPAILSRSRDIPGSKLNYLRLVSALHQPGIDIPEIESIIRREVSLTYKLLRYLNSAFFGFRSEIRSITHALSLLGERETKRWASLVLLTGIAQDKPDELVTQALVRARFCEAMACASGAEDRKEQAFLMGMLSLMSPILDRPMEDILKSLPVADDVRRALMEEKNGLWHHLESIRAMERGDWGILSACAARLRVEESEIPGIYRAALQWAREGLSPVQA